MLPEQWQVKSNISLLKKYAYDILIIAGSDMEPPTEESNELNIAAFLDENNRCTPSIYIIGK